MKLRGLEVGHARSDPMGPHYGRISGVPRQMQLYNFLGRRNIHRRKIQEV
jgi:hypothetical protein